MCGLAGIAGDLDYKDKDILAELLIVASLRGMDSTGVAQIGRDSQEVHIAKSVGNPYELFNTIAWDRGVSAYKSKAWIGHARKATVGVVSRATAHPFHEDHIVGVHNGTLHNWRDLPLDFKPGVDSHALFMSMAKIGVKDTIEFTKGAYALVWFDQESETLNFLRNDQRSLYYALSEDRKKIYWASEAGMLAFVLGRNNIKCMENKEGHRFFPVPVDTHFELSFALDRTFKISGSTPLEGGVAVKSNAPFGLGRVWEAWENRHHAGIRPLPKAPPAKENQALLPGLPGSTAKAAESTTTKPATSPSSNSPSEEKSTSVPEPFPLRKPLLSLVQDNKNESTGDSQGSGRKPPLEEDLNDEIPLFGNEVKGPKGTIMGKAEFENAVKDGCQWCQDNSATFEEQAKSPVKWIEHTPPRFLCNTCSTGAIGQMLQQA